VENGVRVFGFLSQRPDGLVGGDDQQGDFLVLAWNFTSFNTGSDPYLPVPMISRRHLKDILSSRAECVRTLRGISATASSYVSNAINLDRTKVEVASIQ
jgi:hypothetical protein